ncbi:heme exporter protein CcmD [Caldimonas brevitalea]|uniref:Heme exporter protein D n=1 Tax=Caldimonas brevitalea TaxID=413882 RepID=A0A0G3BMM4_9BURK|nr:heme exporter protein CcmD [Caldimonas brevitalea]AKJ29243.1 heme exporter protein D [Caldimonas brevitalea]
MNWGSVAVFFEMGGHGLYVWGAYGVTAVLMAIEPWSAWRRRRRAAAQAVAAAASGEPAR